MPSDSPAPARVPDLVLRKARVQDVALIHKLILDCSGSGGLVLPRSLNELYGRVRDFFVMAPKEGGGVLGCCALSITWEDIAEVRSLVIAPEARGLGFGTRLVEACLSEAVTLGLYRVFTLTYSTELFRRLGFAEVDKNVLPQKVWADCLNCPKFPACDEIAMLLQF